MVVQNIWRIASADVTVIFEGGLCSFMVWVAVGRGQVLAKCCVALGSMHAQYVWYMDVVGLHEEQLL